MGRKEAWRRERFIDQAATRDPSFPLPPVRVRVRCRSTLRYSGLGRKCPISRALKGRDCEGRQRTCYLAWPQRSNVSLILLCSPTMGNKEPSLCPSNHRSVRRTTLKSLSKLCHCTGFTHSGGCRSSYLSDHMNANVRNATIALPPNTQWNRGPTSIRIQAAFGQRSNAIIINPPSKPGKMARASTLPAY